MKKVFMILLTVQLCMLMGIYNAGAQCVPATSPTPWYIGGNLPGGSGIFGTGDATDISVIGKCTPVMQINGGSGGDVVGNVAIGIGSTNWPPQNKFIVENGPSLPVYSFFPPADISVISTSNVTDSNNMNVAFMGTVAKDYTSGASPQPNNFGYIALVSGNYAKNQAYGLLVGGDNAENHGYEGEVGSGSVSSTNVSYEANTGIDGSSNSNNTGMEQRIGSSGSSNINIGVYGQIGWNSTSSTNTGIWEDVRGDGGPTNTGAIFAISGNTTTSSIGIECSVAGSNSAGTPSVVGIRSTLTSGGDGGTENYGLVGDLSAGSPTGGVPYYAVYGIAPLGTGSGAGGSTPGTNALSAYAGYFDGDVFCSNTYYYSDPKLKTNIADYKNALSMLGKLNVKSYDFKQGDYPSMNFPTGKQIGLLSSDLKQVFPNMVKETIQPAIKDKSSMVVFDAVNYNALIPVLVQAVKELDAKTPINDQEVINMLKQQDAKIAEQYKQIEELKDLLADICNSGCAGLQNTSNGSGNAVLYQSNPNPTTNIATISYAINIPFSTAYISVASVNGVVVNKYDITQQGNGKINFDGTAVASGMYKYSLFIDGKLYDTKSLIMIK